uniref:CSN8/PSMD8/EIF3K domain-containing protein n=1 Tax=Araucaria cunninghamii TaxID=56994 RepID=A0A0D6R5X1_ARACU
MELTKLKEAIESKHYHKIADICDELELQLAALGIKEPDGWPYSIHLLGHIYIQDINSARFLWKRIPSSVKESQPELAAVWKIGQCMWTHDYPGVHCALCDFNWSPEVQQIINALSESYTKKVFELLLAAYSTISVVDTARFLGMTEEDAISYTLQEGWTLDTELQMLTVKRRPVVVDQKLDSSTLQNLTEYVFHLEH